MSDRDRKVGQVEGAEPACAEPNSRSHLDELLANPHTRPAALRRIRAWQARQNAQAQALQWKEALKRKLDGVTTTVMQAVVLFQGAIINEKLADKVPESVPPALLEYVLNKLFSELTNYLARKVALEAELAKTIFKEAAALSKSSYKQWLKHEEGGELGAIKAIIGAAVPAAARLVEHAQALIDQLPIEQCALDARLLEATKASPGVKEQQIVDSEEMGQIAHGIESQFLEAAGAPVTGPAEAEQLAIWMLREYRARRAQLIPDQMQALLRDPSRQDIADAEKAYSLDQQVRADKAERIRASNVANAVGAP